MKLLFYFFLLVITTIACNNGRAEKQQPGADTIAASITDTAKLANFPGTSVYIELPNGFAWNETAMGFYKEEDGSVIKYDEFKKMRYAANIPLEEPVGTLTKQQSVTISGNKGEIKTYQDGRTLTRLELSFGSNTLMEFIEATYFSNREQTGKEIMAALNTLHFRN